MSKPLRVREPDLLDRRQRQAAALLLCAVDLPAPMDALVKLWRAGAKVAPGCTVAEVFRNSRPEALRDARELIDTMLAEVDAATEEPTAKIDIPDDWLPSPAAINALPEPLRRYIHDIETACCCQPEIVQENHALKSQARAVSAMVEALRQDAAGAPEPRTYYNWTDSRGVVRSAMVRPGEGVQAIARAEREHYGEP